MNKELIREGIAKLMLWQRNADEYDFNEIEKCWEEAGEPTRDTYLRWASGLLVYQDPYVRIVKEIELPENKKPDPNDSEDVIAFGAYRESQRDMLKAFDESLERLI